MTYRFADLVDTQTLAELLASLHKATGLPAIVLDSANNALASAGWRLGCSLRNMPDTPCASLICRRPQPGETRPMPHCAAGYQLFKCPLGLCDAIVPVLVESESVGAVHIGQFLLTPPDLAWHKTLTRRYHLHEKQHMEMIAQAPVMDIERLEKILAFHATLVDTLADLGLKRLRLRAAEAALARSEGRYRRLLSSVTNYIYTVRMESGRIVSVRHGLGCEPVTGYSSEAFDADPRLWARLVHEEDRQRVMRFFESIMSAGVGQEVNPLEHRIRRRDGALRWIRNTPVVTRGPDGKVSLFEGLVQDITDQKNMEEELKAATLKAEQANRAKSDFLATMSHEIRTPMNAILGLTRLALKRVSDSDVRDFLEGVSEAGASLLAILNDILDFSKIEAGRLEIVDEDFDPLDVLSQAARTLGIQAARKGLVLSVETSGELPLTMRGDPQRLRQVLLNLLGNAVKFTSRGVVTLSARVARDDVSHRDVLQISVADTGIGIPADKQEVIFETFTQADSTTTRRFGGTGLGLAISRQLISMMGGRIWVESEMGHGSTFHITLPLRTGELPKPAERKMNGRARFDAHPVAGASLRPMRILLAEDEPANQMFARTFLEEEGHEVEVAENGARALEKLAEGGFDLVLMDVSMPVMDGLTATRLIRSGQAPGADPEMPIVALTAHAIKDDQDRFMEAGMDACVVKPVDIDELTQILKDVQRGRRPAVKPLPPPPTAKEFDATWLRKWFEGRESVLTALLAIFAEETPRRLQKLRDLLAEAGDSGADFKGVMQEAAQEAHSMKGSAAVVGATTVRAKAARLEEALADGQLQLAEQCLDALAADWLAAQSAIEAGEPQELLKSPVTPGT
ncbi:MAG: ATP-binding protein [Acidobacteriota bacterium]